jgi:soluble lytic murein transglycosylase-like protein
VKYFLFFLCILAVAQTPAESIQKQKTSIAIQREAIRKQAGAAAQYRVTTEPEVECDPLPEAELTPIIDGAAQLHHVDTKLIRAVIDRESGSRPCAVSSKGASGLMQLMPAAVEQFQVTDPFDPKQNVEAGAGFLKLLLEKYKGDLPMVLAAFNAGASTVDRAGGAVPEIKETKDYVEAILKKLSSQP